MLDSIAVNITRIRGILHRMGNLNTGEGEPGHFLIKLREMIRKVLGKGPGVKSARTTKGPEGACGDESIQKEGSQAGPEPRQGGEDNVNLAAGSMSPDGCVAESGTDGPLAEGALILQSKLAEEFAESTDLESASEFELC